MIKQFRVYNDIQTAMKGTSFRVKMGLDEFGELTFSIYKEEISYENKLIFVCNELDDDEVLVGRFNSSNDAEEYVEQLEKLPNLATDIYKKEINRVYLDHNIVHDLSEASEKLQYFVTRGSRDDRKLHINKSLIIQNGTWFYLCYPAPKDSVIYSSKDRTDCVKFIKNWEVK